MKTFFATLLVASSAFAQVVTVPWRVETSSILSGQAGDPTFVFVPQPPTPGVQLIIGTDPTQSGLYAWPVGDLPQLLPGVGQVNSADARGPVLVVSSLTTNTLLVYRVDDAGLLNPVDTGNFNVPTPGQVAFAQRSDGGFEAWVDTSSQTIEHFAMSPIVDGGVTFTSLPSITVPETPSGLAVDDRRGRLYVGQPSLGVIAVEPNGTSQFVVSIDAGTLGTRVGGLDLFLAADGGTLLFSAAAQEGQLKVHSVSGSMVVFRTTLVIGVTDGGTTQIRDPVFLDVYEQPVPGFPKGVLVVQDRAAANYKLVSLADLNAVFPLPPPFIPGGAVVPPVSDAGTDGGADAGVADGGTSPDGGAGGGSGGQSTGGGHSAEPNTPACGCTGGPFAVLPALLLLWWIRRLRS